MGEKCKNMFGELEKAKQKLRLEFLICFGLDLALDLKFMWHIYTFDIDRKINI